MRVRISHLVNSLTRQALYESVPGYVGKEQDFALLEQQIRSQHGVDRVHRFDLGENADGCSSRVHDFLRQLDASDLRHFLSGYPESSGALKRYLSELHQAPPEWIALGTGVVSFISILCHAFYEWGDRVLLPTPSFFVIEEYILRSGALPIYLPLQYEEEFAWTDRMTHQVCEQLRRGPVKMLWLCTPNNPTGQPVPHDTIEELVLAAEEAFAMVVVDEAYGEYTDDLPEYASAARLLGKHQNLIVLRSFSKAYGLAGMRIGYAMMSSRVVHDAVARQMEYFPVTKLSLELALVAARDQDYLAATRRVTRERDAALRARLNSLPGVECLPTSSNIMLVRRAGYSTMDLIAVLQTRGIVVANADIEGLRDQGWVRVTCRDESENEVLCSAFENLT